MDLMKPLFRFYARLLAVAAAAAAIVAGVWTGWLRYRGAPARPASLVNALALTDFPSSDASVSDARHREIAAWYSRTGRESPRPTG